MTERVRVTDGVLADGRPIRWYDRPGAPVRDDPDRRDLPPRGSAHRMRRDPLREEWVSISVHRQDRTFLPTAEDCPLCPSVPPGPHGAGRATEVPSGDYQVVVFENRFPAFSGDADAVAVSPAQVGGSTVCSDAPACGRCEVVCFTDEHDRGTSDLDLDRVDLVIAALVDRTEALSAQAGVRVVTPFENRGEAIGVTLAHAHGQIYAYPFVPPHTRREVEVAASYRRRTGRVLADDVVASELADGARIVHESAHWVAFVPFAARYPVEVHLYPRERVPDLPALGPAAREALPAVYLDLVRGADAFYGIPLPSVTAWHQAPVHEADGRSEGGLRLEITSVQRAPDRLKYLAGSESAMGAFINDRSPEQVAARWREAVT